MNTNPINNLLLQDNMKQIRLKNILEILKQKDGTR